VKVTKAEREAIIKELAERMKDIVFQTAEQKFQKVITPRFLETILKATDDTPFAMSFTITMVSGDFKQVLGRMRRAEREEWGKEGPPA